MPQPTAHSDPQLMEWRSAMVTALLVMVLAATAVWRHEQHQVENARTELAANAGQHASAIQRNVERALSATYPLAALVRQTGDSPLEFESLAAKMLPYYVGASALALAPGGVMRQIVPLDGNEPAVGHDLLNDPGRDKEARAARESGSLTLAGPFELVQGGLGAAGRLPVYLGADGDRGRFWGFVSVVIRFPEVLVSAHLPELESRGYDWELWRVHPDSGQRQIIAASAHAPYKPVELAVSVPGGFWTLSVAPNDGWLDLPRIAAKLVAALGLSLLLGWLVGLLARNRRHSAELEARVAEATALARDREARYRNIIDVSPVPMALNDEQGRITFLNRAFIEIFGYTRDDIPTLSDWWPQAYPDAEYRQWVAEAWQQRTNDAFHRGLPFEAFELTVRAKDGTDKIALVAAAPLDAEFSGEHLVTLVDITAIKHAQREIAEQRIFRDALMESIPGVAYVLDGEARFRYFNREWAKIAELPVESLDGLCVYSLFQGEEAGIVKAAVQQVFAEGCGTVQATTTGHHGLRVPFFFTGRRFELHGEPLLVGIGVDISSRLKAEDALRHSEMLFSSAFHASPVAASITRASDGKMLAINHNYTRDFGWTEADCVGRSSLELGIWVDTALRKTWRAMIERDGRVIDFEMRLGHRDGSVREAAVSAEFAEVNGERCILSHVLDITERKAIERALRSSEERATGYIDYAPSGIFVADNSGRYVNVNPAACAMSGYSREEMLSGMTIADIAGPGDRDRYNQIFANVLATGRGEFDLPLRRKDQSVITVSLRATVLPSGEVIGFANDVTETRAIQSSLSALATTFAPLSGLDLHRAACRHLANALGLDYVFVGELTADRSGVDVLAGWARGAPMSPFAYALADTPCANVLKQEHAIYDCGVQALFPNDELLVQMKIQAYIGATLFDKEQRPMGILVGLCEHPLPQRGLAERLLGVFAESISAELVRTRIERALSESESHYRSLFDDSSIVMLLIDPSDGSIREANTAAGHFYGYTPETLRTLNIRDINTLPSDQIRGEMEQAITGGRQGFEFVHRLADGSQREVMVSCGPLVVEGRTMLLSSVLDITERKQAEARMRQAFVVFNASSQGITTTDAHGTITSVNPAFTRITGYTADEVVGKTTSILKSGRHDEAFYEAMWIKIRETGRWEGEIWNRRRDGLLYPEWLTISAVTDAAGRVIEYVALFNDITERKQKEEEIWRQANFDALTGLANRNLLSDRLERGLAQARRNRRKLGLVFLDLDGFKWINDTLGHDVGDQLLVEVARRLLSTIRDQDTAARLGGDEFTVVIHDLSTAEDMLAFGEKLVAVLREPFDLVGSTHQISGSVGITIFPDDGEDVQTLLKNADIAMYKAKQGGKNRFQFYARHMQIDARARLEMEADLRKALSGEQFVLHYQPIVDADSGELVGAEALVRWQHPERGMISPMDFIPVAEDSGLIVPIGEWVLREAARQWAEWRSKGFPPLRISVNVSSVQFREPTIARLIVDVLREYDVEPGRLLLEITESVLMDGSNEAERRMRDIKALGVGYALDDFGTGFSSLSYLKRFPVDIVKIDRSFINDCPEDHNDAHLVEAIINMAHSLDLRVTAEGVETEAQFEFLRDLGCDYVQGYLAGRPLPAESFEVLIERRQLLLPTDGASIEETRFLAAMRQDKLDVDAWLERLLTEHHRDLVGYRESRDWVSRGLNLRKVVQAHLDWRRRLDEFISTDRPEVDFSVDEAGSALRCELGGWIALYREDSDCFERLEHAHEAFHRLAGQIVDDHLNGHRTLARRALMGISFRKASREVVAAVIDCYRSDLAARPAESKPGIVHTAD